MKNCLILLFAISVFSASVQSHDSAKLDQYLSSLASNDKAMLSVAIVADGEPVYQRAVGFADVEQQVPANKDTQYRVGSITKTFTATMIFQLIEEGKLSLDTKLAKFYPQIKHANDITISMLLRHRSGIHNFTNDPAYKTYMTEPKSRAEMLDIIEQLDSDFAPNSRASYSNSGYVLLGYILEDITDDSYANQLQKRISAKLGLTHTMYGGTIQVDANQARPYRYQNSSWVATSTTDMSIPHGAGAIVSTPTELGEFFAGLFSGKLVSADSLEQMKAINEGFGHGLFKLPFYDKAGYGHNGGIDAFSSQAVYFEADNVAYAISANGLNYPLNEISKAILSIYYELPFELPNFAEKALQLSPPTLAKYAGIYSSKELPIDITLSLNDGQLMAQATGQQALPLSAYSTHEFRFEPAGITIVFEHDGDNVDYSAFELKQSGGQFSFTRQ